MGLILDQFRFDKSLPTLAEIAARMTEICGLDVKVEEQHTPEGDFELYQLDARLAFECYSSCSIEIHAYRPDAVREHLELLEKDGPLPFRTAVQGFSETAAEPVIHVQGYLGQEPTLLMVTCLALASLGGQCRHPSDESLQREFSVRITPEELSRRHRRVQTRFWLQLPIAIAFACVAIPISLVTLPIRVSYAIWKVWQQRRGQAE